MSKFELKINSRVEISLEDNIVTSTIQDIKDESFFISMPMEKGNYIKLEINEKLEIYNYNENANIYKFNSKVIGRGRCGNTPLYELSLPENVVKIQRREFFRVEMTSPVDLKTKDGKKVSALMMDLSGGGLKLKTSKELEKNEIIEIALKSIKDKEEIKIQGQVVRNQRDKNGEYIYGIRFYNIENKIREKIIQFIFSIMRAQKKPK